MKHLILIGLPGSGKTTVGRRVSQITALPFIDLDEVIEKKAGISIPQFFAQQGEAAFRQVEHDELITVLSHRTSVISTGGGIVLSVENRELLRKNGYVLFLDRKIEDILTTLDVSHRPALQNISLQAMAEKRRPLYLSCADACITENDVEMAAQQCAELWRKQKQ